MPPKKKGPKRVDAMDEKMTRKKEKSKKEPKMMRVIDCRTDEETEKEVEERTFKEWVQKENVVCFNMLSFMATCLSEDSPGSDVWWPAVDPQPGISFSMDETVFFDDPKRHASVWDAWKLAQEKRHILVAELISEEEAAKGKRKEQAGNRRGEGKPSVTEPHVSYTDLRTGQSFRTPLSMFRRSVTDDLVCFNFAAYKEIYEVDDEGMQDSWSRTPCLWRAHQHWDDSLTKEHIYVELKRPLHSVISSIVDVEEELSDVEEQHGAEHSDSEWVLASGAKELNQQLVVDEQQPEQKVIIDEAKKVEHLDAQLQEKRGATVFKELNQQQKQLVVDDEQQEEHLVVDELGLDAQQGSKEHVDAQLLPLLQKKAKQLVPKEADEVTEGAQAALKFLQEKGGKATAKEMCAAMCSILAGIYQSNEGVNKRFDEVDDKFKQSNEGVNKRFDEVDDKFKQLDDTLNKRLDVVNKRLDQVDGKLKDMKKSMKELNGAVSMIAERSSRSSFGSVFKSLTPGARVVHPITNKVLPYQTNAQLERLGQLCSQPKLYGRKMCAHYKPKFAEIDILLKIVQDGSHVDETTSPEVGKVKTTTVDEDRHRPFHTIAIAEVTRSLKLCALASEYSHPNVLSNTPSSKLLYKFVQLERGISAAMTYYNVSLDSIQGVAIISPSFMELHEPKKLISRVLHFSRPLVALRQLHKMGRVWLLDI